MYEVAYELCIAFVFFVERNFNASPVGNVKKTISLCGIIALIFSPIPSQETLERVKEELGSMCEKHAKVVKEKSEAQTVADEKERESEEEKRRQQGQVTTLEGKITQLTAKNDQLGAHVEELQVQSKDV